MTTLGSNHVFPWDDSWVKASCSTKLDFTAGGCHINSLIRHGTKTRSINFATSIRTGVLDAHQPRVVSDNETYQEFA